MSVLPTLRAADNIGQSNTHPRRRIVAYLNVDPEQLRPHPNALAPHAQQHAVGAGVVHPNPASAGTPNTQAIRVRCAVALPRVGPWARRHPHPQLPPLTSHPGQPRLPAHSSTMPESSVCSRSPPALADLAPPLFAGLGSPHSVPSLSLSHAPPFALVTTVKAPPTPELFPQPLAPTLADPAPPLFTGVGSPHTVPSRRLPRHPSRPCAAQHAVAFPLCLVPLPRVIPRARSRSRSRLPSTRPTPAPPLFAGFGSLLAVPSCRLPRHPSHPCGAHRCPPPSPRRPPPRCSPRPRRSRSPPTPANPPCFSSLASPPRTQSPASPSCTRPSALEHDNGDGELLSAPSSLRPNSPFSDWGPPAPGAQAQGSPQRT
ncbi:hypothetical protein DFH08DRAFT_969406 [Mycena albidolilacea]|uniref:Uncharacterized protein n=1 Tax=Mycena albidolilacea TaxID=1033008 RepID=A0AAD6ZIX8_9AGAR|nr:hypothetical protein DFH08DRAFT_969406 [Mycena albidolilacea]